MHSRNPYKTRLDFRTLADNYPLLKPFVSPNIDFRDSAAQREACSRSATVFIHIHLQDSDTGLAQARLWTKLGPSTRSTVSAGDYECHVLCDWLTQLYTRLNYVLWIQDIVFSTSTSSEVRGLDIGTGASAIYPLLACSLSGNSNWSFIATEIDPRSLQYAYKNIEDNHLASRITLYTVSAESEFILAPLFNDSKLSLDFTMCNPPFYGSTSEIETSADNKEFSPNAVCTGAEHEMITPGGETAFVLKMLQESCHENIKYRCRWFTSMLGKLSSVQVIVSELRSLKVDNYALTQFVQGTTRRWAVAWSFSDERLPDQYSRPTAPSLSPFLPLPTTLQQRVTSTSLQARNQLSQVLSTVERLSFTFTEGASDDAPGAGARTMTARQPNVDNDKTAKAEWTCTVSAFENTWSRAARRSRKRALEGSGSSTVLTKAHDSLTEEIFMSGQERTSCDNTHPNNEKTTSHPSPIFICRISAEYDRHDHDRPEARQRLRNNNDKSKTAIKNNLVSEPELSLVLTAQWLRGADRLAFEGFWSHVSRKLKNANI